MYLPAPRPRSAARSTLAAMAATCSLAGAGCSFDATLRTDGLSPEDGSLLGSVIGGAAGGPGGAQVGGTLGYVLTAAAAAAAAHARGKHVGRRAANRTTATPHTTASKVT